MKNKYIYPAIFQPGEDGGYVVTFPDLDGCFTQGDDLEDALYMAWDAAAGWLLTAQKLNEDIPESSDIKSIVLENDRDFTSIVNIDLSDYIRKTNNKAVKKTLSIPAWLNEEAEKQHVNFSGLLQSALKEHLHITDR